MSDLEQLLNELVTSAREDATDGFEGLSMTTRHTRTEIRRVFANLVGLHLDPMLESVIDTAQDDAREGRADNSPATQVTLSKVREAYDELADGF